MLSAGSSAIYVARSATQWDTFQPSNVAGTGISVTYGNGVTTYANTGVTSFLTSLSGLTPSTTTTGAVTLGGTLGTGGGGTGITTTPTLLGSLLIGNGTTYTNAQLTPSTNIYIANAAGSITITSSKYWAESSTAPLVLPSATGNQSTAIGTSAVSSKYGEVSFASGAFGIAGDAQSAQYVLRNQTTTASSTPLYMDGSTAQITIPTGFCYSFDADIICMSTTGTIAGSWNIKGMIVNFATAAASIPSTSTTFISVTPATGSGLLKGSVSTAASGSSGGTGTLSFNVTGVASTTFHWVCVCKTVEVGAA